MRQKLLFILLTIIFLLFRIYVNAQMSPRPDRNLEAELGQMDSIVFANVYTCNTASNETFFTDDVEFYHDKGGVTKSRKTLVEQLKNNFCGEGKSKLRRELTRGSMRVYPIKDYGAVQLGDHRFYITEDARLSGRQGKEVLSGVAKFIHVWKYENGQWRISRVFSYDHNAAGGATSAISGELYQTISSQDSGLFAAFNAHDIDLLRTFFTDDLEFYHDKSGLTNYGQTNENFKKMFDQSNEIKRELVPNSLEVYPIKDYGAIAIGEHQFCHVDNGKKDCDTFAFIILWQNQDGNWKVSRVISYNH
jgi:ketosteroid isomerase-like protein